VIYLNKILPVFLLPTGITLLLVVAGLILRRRSLCWIGIAVLWLASTPLVSHQLIRAAEGWQIRKPLATVPSAEAIVVLSSGRSQPPGDPDVSEWGDADRFYGGIDLYKAGKAPLLIFTGGWVPWMPNAKPEGEVLVRYAADLGIPRDCMLITGKVATTNDESHAVAALLAARQAANLRPRVLLVTSAFHMRRAQMLFARAGLEIVPFPVDFKVSVGQTFILFELLPNAGSLNETELAFREMYGLVFYGLFGRWMRL
jgi:uncharacterized SAM-binding protein YcdF (DUF218 family)